MRAITFRNLAPGHWVNTETGVELIRGKHRDDTGKLRWYVARPSRTRPEGREAVCVRDSLAAARRYARLDTVPVAREALALAYDEATAAPVPYVGAPAALVFKHRSTTDQGRTWYTTADERYEIIGRPVAGVMGSAVNPDRAFTPYRAGVAVGPAHRRLKDAQQAAQRDWTELCKAEASARLTEQARLAGDPQWQDAASGQVILAHAEDARRVNERRARAGTGPRQLSGWGALRAAHRAGAALA